MGRKSEAKGGSIGTWGTCGTREKYRAQVRKRLLPRLPVAVGYALLGSVSFGPDTPVFPAPPLGKIRMGGNPAKRVTQLHILLRKRVTFVVRYQMRGSCCARGRITRRGRPPRRIKRGERRRRQEGLPPEDVENLPKALPCQSSAGRNWCCEVGTSRERCTTSGRTHGRAPAAGSSTNYGSTPSGWHQWCGAGECHVPGLLRSPPERATPPRQAPFRSLTDLENANLPQRRLPDLLVLVRLLELFDRHDLPRLSVAALEDHAVRPAHGERRAKELVPGVYGDGESAGYHASRIRNTYPSPIVPRFS